MIRWLGNLLLLGFSLTIGLGLAELMVRIVRPQLTYRFPRGLFVSDSVTGYALTPGFVGRLNTPEYRTDIRVSQQGLRDERVFGPKPAGAKRILMLGDSFTMGVGVERDQTLAALLERDLRAEGRAVEVVNSGVAGWGTLQELAYLEAKGLSFSPDALVLVFYTGNDVADNAAKPHVVEDGYLAAPGAHEGGLLPHAVSRALSLHSQLYHLLWPYKVRFVDGGEDQRVARRTGFVELYGPAQVAGASVGWDRTFAAIARLGEVARERGLRGVVVLMPDPLVVSPTKWRAAIEETGATDVSAARPHERVATAARAAQLSVVDLLPVLTSEGDGSRFYFEQDGHLTVEATERVETVILPAVRESLGLGGADAR